MHFGLKLNGLPIGFLLIFIGLLAVGAVAAYAAYALSQPIKVASGMASRILCSGTFVCGMEPHSVYEDVLRPLMGFHLLAPFLTYQVDRNRREVRTRIAGLFNSRAVYHDGWGCILVQGRHDKVAPYPAKLAAEQETARALLPPIAGPHAVEPTEQSLRIALDRAFAEAPEMTKAVIVVHNGSIIAERYAHGCGIDTPLHGWSATKSVINALTGILVRQNRLFLQQDRLLHEWRASNDLRRTITVDQLLRQTSGLAVKQTDSGFDPSSRMKFIESDMAGFAEKAALHAAPGTVWAYSDANYVLMSRIIRDQVGGSGADLARFAERELFQPLGMRDVTLEVDATGTPIGSAFMFAPARDWARFGMLYLEDGTIGRRRILPEGWVRYSATPTLSSGYGAGFFTNRVKGGEISNWGIGWELPHAPADAFFARGFMGQYVIVVPSKRLVVVRMGSSWVRDASLENTGRLVSDVIAALDKQAGNEQTSHGAAA